MDTTKKIYSAPKLTRVRLVVKNSVLGTCHSSPVVTPKVEGVGGCATVYTLNKTCWVGVMP